MKKSIVSVTLVLNIICSSAIANPGHEIGKQVEAEFNRRFLKAEDVQWEELGDFIIATFKLNGPVLFAYFNPQGELIGVTRNILSDQLPLNLMITLKNHYANYWIVDLFEMYSNGKTHYFVTLKTVDQELVLKSEGEEWKVLDEESVEY